MLAVHIEGSWHPPIFLFDTFFRVNVPLISKTLYTVLIELILQIS
jgi:hypothetical protein